MFPIEGGILSSHFEKIKSYKFTWKKFGTLLSQFVKENINEFENIDLIISLRRGGSILGQTLACLIQDMTEKNTLQIGIKDIPSGIAYKNTIPTFLNRLIASLAEIREIPKLKSELKSELLKKPKDKKMQILVVDDNITTCLRQRLICESILEWYGDSINVKKLAFCVQNKKKAVDKIIFNESIIEKRIVAMPWHNVRKIAKKINPVYHIEQIQFNIKYKLDLEQLYNDFLKYSDDIYKILGLNGVIKSNNNNIFNVSRHETSDSVEINSGSFGYTIWNQGESITIYMTPTDAIPKLCEKNKFSINEHSYRLCDSSFREDELCYVCSFLYCSRDIFYLLLQSLKNAGMKEDKLKNISITFSSIKPEDLLIEKYTYRYLRQLYQEKEMPQIYEGINIES